MTFRSSLWKKDMHKPSYTKWPGLIQYVNAQRPAGMFEEQNDTWVNSKTANNLYQSDLKLTHLLRADNQTREEVVDSNENAGKDEGGGAWLDQANKELAKVRVNGRVERKETPETNVAAD